MKFLLEQLLVAAVRPLVGKLVPQLPEGAVTVERTRDGAHGDFTSSVAMRLSKGTGKDPREVAQAIVGALPPSSLVARVEVAGNGFINFFLAPAVLAGEVRRVHELGDAYGRSSIGAGRRVTVGVLSSPPRDVMQGRYGAYSEALSNVLSAAGYDVWREGLLEAPLRSPQSPGGLERSGSGSGSSGPGSSGPGGSERSGAEISLSRPAIEGFLPPVTLYRGNEPQKLTPLNALRDEVGDDACRFFFLMRSHEQPLDFDLRLATSRTNENPLYSVQYAHARVASAMKEARARGISFDLAAGLDHLERLVKDTEQALIAALLRFPEELESAAANCAPHSIVYYLRDVANAFHTYYHAEKWIVDDVELRNARLALVLAAGRVIRNGLALIGVSAPESM